MSPSGFLRWVLPQGWGWGPSQPGGGGVRVGGVLGKADRRPAPGDLWARAAVAGGGMLGIRLSPACPDVHKPLIWR